MTSDPMVVGERYVLGDLLGRGGMAEVRRALDQRLGRPVAVKQLRADLATDPTFQARFRREAQSAAGLNHPTIVAVYDTGEETDARTGVSIPYIVMELVEGPTLRDVLRDGRKILPERALELTQGVLDALSYSHKAGIIHRDIKPANVMLTPTGGVKVMDFGIARAVADTSVTMTQTAAVIGTAQYLSPEQARGETVDARSDIYSAGCLLYELLVGRPPFIGDSPVSVAYQHVREAPVPPSQLDPVISPEIDAVTLRALAKDAMDRYQSAREMKADISRVLAGQQATAVVPRVMAVAAPVGAPDAPTRVVPTAIRPTPVEDPPDEEQPKKSRAGRVMLIVLLILGLIMGAYAAYATWGPGGSANKIEVPKVLTFNQQQATELISAQGLKIDVRHTNGDGATENQVVAQNPAGGARVDPDTTVVVTVNDGPKTGVVPEDLIGANREDAAQRLTELGFTPKPTAAKSEKPSAQEGEVLSVSPKGGSTVPLGTTVTITYATGKSEVPNFEGVTLQRAQELATEQGFSAQFSTRTQTSSQPAGTVIDQNPAAGTKADRTTVLEITVAKASNQESTPPSTPPPSPTPDPSDSGSGSPSPTPTET